MLLVEFAYNNTYQSSIGMTPYEALYGHKCRLPLNWDDVGERQMLGLKIEQKTCGPRFVGLYEILSRVGHWLIN